MNGVDLWNYLEQKAVEKYGRPDWVMTMANIQGDVAKVRIESKVSKSKISGYVNMPEVST